MTGKGQGTSMPQDADSWLELSRMHFSRHEFGEAAACADRAIALQPENPEAWMARADALGESYRFSEAQACLLRILAIDPVDAQGWLLRCRACLLLHRNNDAEACIAGAENHAVTETTWTLMAGLFTEFHLQNPARACELRSRRSGGTRAEYLAEERALLAPAEDAGQESAGRLRLLKLIRLATACESTGDYERAVAYYDELLGAAPRLASIWSAKGRCYTGLADLQKAEECFVQAIRINPRLTVGWADLGNLLGSRGGLDGGLTCLDTALGLEPERQYLWLAKAALYAGSRQFDKALDCTRQALVLDPEWADALTFEGICEYHLNWFQKAINSLSHAIRIDPRSAEAWRCKGDCLRATGDIRAAQECYATADALERGETEIPAAWSGSPEGQGADAGTKETVPGPGLPAAGGDPGLSPGPGAMPPAGQDTGGGPVPAPGPGMLLVPGTHPAKRPVPRAGQKVPPEPGPAPVREPVFSLSSRKSTRAPPVKKPGPGPLQRFSAAFFARTTAPQPEPSENAAAPEPAPPDVRGIIREGTALFRQKQYREALAHFSHATEVNPRSAEAWLMAARCHQHLTESDKALAAYRNVLDIDERNGVAWFNSGVIHLNAHEPEEAIPCFTMAARIGYSPAKAHLNKGLCLVMLDKKPEAIDEFRLATNLDPKLRRAWSLGASLLEEVEGPVAGARCLDLALKEFPSDKELLTNRALMVKRLGLYEEALRSVESAVTIDPGYQPALDLRQELLEKLGKL